MGSSSLAREGTGASALGARSLSHWTKGRPIIDFFFFFKRLWALRIENPDEAKRTVVPAPPCLGPQLGSLGDWVD